MIKNCSQARHITRPGAFTQMQSSRARTAGSNAHHSATLKRKSSKIRASRQKAWRILGDIASMPRWAPGVSRVTVTSDSRRGVGAVRKVTFEDGRAIEEHVVSWSAGGSFTYVATDGLPLRAYVATIAIDSNERDGTITITWQSYMNSVKMPEVEFARLLDDMGRFYEGSLANLAEMLRGRK